MSIYRMNFAEGPAVPFAQIGSVGTEVQHDRYSLYGLKRQDHSRHIFQYTISGKGEIRVANRTFGLEPGNAFLVRTGTDYHYYVPQESPHWEFMFITLIGEEAAQCWSYLNDQRGPVALFAPHSNVIDHLLRIYRQASDNAITNGYQAAAMATQFLMELYQDVAFSQQQGSGPKWPESIVAAAALIREKYAEIESVEQLSRAIGTTVYTLSRLFHKTTGMTTIQYLTNTRIEKAMELLRHSDLRLDNIARNIGFSNDNYFNKVFRKATGISPGQFRAGKKGRFK